MEYDDIDKIFRDEKSVELFGRKESELTISERILLGKYIKSYLFPIWSNVTIRGYNTMYIINDIGHIINLKTGKNIHPSLDRKGYCSIKLKYDERFITTFIHRLVAQAFIPNPENKPEVNHINGNKLCNWVGNLEWVTSKENIAHAFQNGLRTISVGENANSSIYSDEQIHSVCKLLESGMSIRDVSNKTGVTYHSVAGIRSGRCWRNISEQYSIRQYSRNAIGSNSASSKYSDDQIHRVCKLLEDSSNRMTDIAMKTGVGRDMIFRIKTGKNWTHISKLYHISDESNK